MKNTCLILTILFFGQLAAQTNDNAQYFDDGGLSTKKLTVKLNIAAIVTGDLPVSAEYAFTRHLALEAGVGLSLPYYLREIPELLWTNDDFVDWIPDPQSGYSLLVQPKFYLGDYPEAFYTGLQYRRRFFSMSEEKVTFQEFTFNWGYQLSLGKRWIIDYGFGLGFRFVDLDSKTRTEDFNTELAVPMILKIGYLF